MSSLKTSGVFLSEVGHVHTPQFRSSALGDTRQTRADTCMSANTYRNTHRLAWLIVAQNTPPATSGGWTHKLCSVLEIPRHVSKYHTAGKQKCNVTLCTSVDEPPKMLSKESEREYTKYDSTHIKLTHKKTKKHALFQNYIQR